MGFVLQFTRRFVMAHRLTGGDSPKCETPHGHNQTVTVDLAPRTPFALDGRRNMAAEFGAVKERWHAFVDERLDHALQLSDSDPLLALAETHFPSWKLVVTPGDPTTELMAVLLKAKCQAFLDAAGHELVCVRVTLVETPTNTVVFEGDHREVMPRGDGWWLRADDSTLG